MVQITASHPDRFTHSPNSCSISAWTHGLRPLPARSKAPHQHHIGSLQTSRTTKNVIKDSPTKVPPSQVLAFHPGQLGHDLNSRSTRTRATASVQDRPAKILLEWMIVTPADSPKGSYRALITPASPTDARLSSLVPREHVHADSPVYCSSCTIWCYVFSFCTLAIRAVCVFVRLVKYI